MKRLVFFAVFVLTSLLGYGYTVLPKFTAVTPSGHTLSFEIDTIDFGLPGGGAWVTCGEPHGNVHFGSISAYSTLSGHVIIPDSVEYNNVKYPVTAIGSYAFCRCRNITSITIPSTVVFIGQYSLNGCSGMDTINVESTEAPAIEDNSVFVGSNTYANVLIPSCSYLQSYIDEWGTTFNYICFSPIFELSINSNDSTWGMGSYNGLGDSSVVLFATSNYGYHFDHWSTGSTANPDTITLNSDTTITAFFAPNQYALHVSSADSSLGIVGGGGLYEYLDTVSISAAPVAHHHFVRWNDDNTMNPRNIIVTNDTSFTAIFAIDTHSVSLQVDSIIHGVCNGNGDYAYGTAATAVAIPYSGYQFSHWSNGSIYNPYTFAVVDDTRLTAYFRTIGEPYQGILVLHDTLLVHDTTYITREVHDTTFINHYVHDTTFINNYVHDTLIAYVNQYVHDTTYINNYIHDTSYIYRAQYDTLFVYNTVHDTAWLTAYVHDTAFVNNYIHDTVWLTQTVWEYIHDTVIQHVNH